MDRELILNVKDNNYGKKELEIETETVKKLLPYIESYFAFEVSNDIFNSRSLKMMKGSNKIRNFYKHRRVALPNTMFFVKID